jgi:predicted site-specific integrase-resolvase
MINPSTLQNRAVLGPDDDAPCLSPRELADHWGVHPQTVYRDLRKGALRGFLLPGGRIRIRPSDARRYGRPIE